MEGSSKRQQLGAQEVIKLSRAGNCIGISANEDYIWKVIRHSQSLQFLLPQIREQYFKSSKPQSSCFNLRLFLYFLLYAEHVTHAKHKKYPPATEKPISCISKLGIFPLKLDPAAHAEFWSSKYLQQYWYHMIWLLFQHEFQPPGLTALEGPTSLCHSHQTQGEVTHLNEFQITTEATRIFARIRKENLD